MKILDRYILKKILSTYFFVMLILMAIITVIDYSEKMDKYARHNLSGMEVLGYYLDFVPWVAGFINPIIVFIAIIYVTSRLAAHTEIIAILSSGISFRRMLLPYILASFVIASISFVLTGWIIPNATKSRLAFELRYFNNRKYFEGRNIHLQVAPNVYLYMQTYNNVSNIGYEFSMERLNGSELIEKLTAQNIQWDSTKQKWKLSYWKYKKVNDVFTSTGQIDVSTFQKTGDTMDTTLVITPKDFETQDRSYDGMTIPELDEQIEKIKFRGSTGAQMYESEKHSRFASPFTTFILVFMGVIVSSRKSRGGTGLQIALGFILTFIFILFFMLSRTFAEAGQLQPIVAAWIPNVIFGIISGTMYRFTPR